MTFEAFIYLIENYWLFLTAAMLIGVATGWQSRSTNSKSQSMAESE